MRSAHVRSAAFASCTLLALACQSTSPSAPEQPAGPSGGLDLSATSCDGSPATHILVAGGPGTNGSWFVGTSGADVIVGTGGGDQIDGGGGTDRICLRGGDDEGRGGAGKDRLFGGAGADHLSGGEDADWLDGGGGNDVLEGDGGKDKLFGGGGRDTLHGGNENDQLDGGVGNDVLFGDSDNDALNGGPGTDECDAGGQPNDTTANCEGESEEGGLLQLVAGRGFTCALTTDGAAYCWGTDTNGQLGDGEAGGAPAPPSAVVGGHTFVRLASGGDHTCGIRTDGAAYCWGANGSGQLGSDTGGNPSDTPIAVTGGHTWASLAANTNHTCGVRTDGAAYCWGRDVEGQLGDGSATPNTSTPGAVIGGHTFTTLAAGFSHTCGVRTDGAAYCWGYDSEGQLGDGTSGVFSATPVAVTGGHIFDKLSALGGHTCGVRLDGAAYCWGRDFVGQLGDGTFGGFSATPGAVTGGHIFASITGGGRQTCGVRTDGAAYCWGLDDNGQLGDGTVGTPDNNPTPLLVTGSHTWDVLVAGDLHTCGIRTDGAAYCWGDDEAGEGGDGSPDPGSPTPAPVIGLP